MRLDANAFASAEATQGGGASWILEGGYACLIGAVEDATTDANPALGLVLNPFDPKTKKLMYPMGEMSGEEAWRHTFTFFVGAWQQPGVVDLGRMKALTQAVEQTAQNKGFVFDASAENAEQQLVGKWVGVVFRRYGYTPKAGRHAGEYREGCEIGGVCAAADAIAGNYSEKWAEPRNVKAKAEPAVVQAPPVTPAPVQAPVAVPVAPAPAPDLADEDIPF